MITPISWKEFRDTGLLWFINSILHTFGMALVVDIDEKGEITKAYPARVKFRGFDEKSNSKGYIKLSEYMNNNSEILLKEAKDE